MAQTTTDQQLKNPTMHQLLQLQQQQKQQLLNTTIMWSCPAAAATGCPAPNEADDDDITGATWPPRSYTCAFCRREFRSAQALGGHMNLHRRDRARMRCHGAAQSKAAAPMAADFAVLYPILNSNAAGAVFIPSSTGDVVLSSAMARAGHDPCYGANVRGEAEEIDLELRLGWS